VEGDVFNGSEAIVELDEKVDFEIQLEQLLLDRRRTANATR